MAPMKYRGFTLIEIMIVTAIIGILSAVAVPNFIRYQYRSKAAEAPLNLQSIRTGQLSYMTANGFFVDCSPSPATAPGAQKRPWLDVGGKFDAIGWKPDGAIFFQYDSEVGATMQSFTAAAQADVDNNLQMQIWAYERRSPGGEIAACPFGCSVIEPEKVHNTTSGDIF